MKQIVIRKYKCLGIYYLFFQVDKWGVDSTTYYNCFWILTADYNYRKLHSLH